MTKPKIQVINAKYSIGELIQHRLFDYRGVIFDIDPNFQLTDEWYDIVARSRPPKDKPWYHVLVHNDTKLTYVAEQNLASDLSGEVIINPMLENYFSELRDGRYINTAKIN